MLKKPPSGNSQESLGGGFSLPEGFHQEQYLDHAHPIMTMDIEGQDMWVDQSQAPDDSHILITLSNGQGVHTTLVSPNHIGKVNPAHYVVTPKERVETVTQKRVMKAMTVVRIMGYALLGVLVLFSAGSATGYIKARVVLTGSMVPTINPGDIVVTVNPKYETPKLHDVISYQARQFDGQKVAIFSHRIIGGNAQAGWIVKGDHNPSPDIQHPSGADVLGVVVFVIPYIGKFLTKQALFFIIPIVIGLWVAFEGMKEVPEDD